MRVLLLGNNWVSVEIAKCIREQGDQIVGLVLHPVARRKFGEEILAAAELGADRVFDASGLSEPFVLEHIASLAPEIGVSSFFAYILRAPLLDLFRAGCVNLHPALLPYNRGSFPNVWSIVNGTPAGATLHYVDAGVDTGDIIGQLEVTVSLADTGETLYRKLEIACVELFRSTWPSARSGNAPRHPQIPTAGTSHKVTDVQTIDEIHLDASYTARDLLNILRARTFSGCKGAFVVENGRKFYLQIHMSPED